MNKVDIKVYQMYPDVFLPNYATAGSAGCDVRAYLKDNMAFPDQEAVILPGRTVLIPTGLRFAVPDGYEMQIRARSGMSIKTKLRLCNAVGTLDSDFQGQLMIIFENIDYREPYIVHHNDRIAQLIIAPVYQANFVMVEKVEDLGVTDKHNGFGSTGIQ